MIESHSWFIKDKIVILYKLRSKLLIYYYNFLLKEFNKLYSWSNQMIQTNRNRYIKYKTKYNAK